MRRTYSELMSLPTFEERFEYLKLNGRVGELTFGPNRIINQRLYHGNEWKVLKDELIIRDDGCDLACPDRILNGVVLINGVYKDIKQPIYLHHLNPIKDEDILQSRPCVFDPENLVCVSFSTHEAIHYGDYSLLKGFELITRKPNDTIPWR